MGRALAARAIAAAIALYCVWAALLIAQKPGLQYDEALLVEAAVHMSHSPLEIALPHDPYTWTCIAGRCFPLMTVRYVGPVKEYLCLPLFALFGPHVAIIRVLAMLMGALGIWGISKFVTDQISPPLGAATAFILAINPAYVDLTIFDNDAVAVLMSAVGLLCLAFSRYLRLRTAWAAFWAGAAIGFGVWARSNFVWLLMALAGAALIVFSKRLLAPLRLWAAMAAGGVLGGLPFLVYQAISRGGTWEGLAIFHSKAPLRELISTRWILFSESLLSDREHRAIWDGPPMEDWQRWFFPIAALASCLICLAMRDSRQPDRSLWARFVAIAFPLLGAILFLSRVDISEHHLIALLPLAAITVVLACSIIHGRYRSGWAAVAGLAVVYVVSACAWQLAAMRGLHNTGGVRVWSDGVFGLTNHLRRYEDREIKILDWGLQNNLYVLSDGKIRSREIFWDATTGESGLHRTWTAEIQEGGVFLINGPSNRQIPAASTGFLQALDELQPRVQRFSFRQRDGAVYAEVIEVQPHTGRPASQIVGNSGETIGLPSASFLSANDPRFARRATGFYQAEEAGWRWTRKDFSISLDAPPGTAQTGARLLLDIYIPDAEIQKWGGVTLSARIGSHALAAEKYRQAGKYVFTRDIAADWMEPGATRIDFSLDKSLPPTPREERELGIIVASASLQPLQPKR